MSEDPRAKARRLVDAMLRGDAFSAWLGLEVLEVRPGGCTVRMSVREEMANGFGVCHGGVTFALADSALAFASNTHGTVTVSVENSMTYPAAAHVGDVLTATAEEEATSARLAYYRVVVRAQDDRTVALFRGTVYRTQKELVTDE